MTVDTIDRSANGLSLAHRGPVIGGVALHAADIMAAWASAARDAAAFVAQLVHTDFMPAHFRPRNDSPEAVALAVASGTAAVLCALEVGMSPLQGLQGFYVIQGRPAMYAGTMVGLVLARGHEVWTEDLTDARAIVCGKRKGSDHVERATFTIQRAQQAGYVAKNAKYRTDPQAMLLARAQSDCCKRVARDVLMGLSSVEEMWDEEGTGEPATGQRTIQRAGAVRKATPAAVEAAPQSDGPAESPPARKTAQRRQTRLPPAPEPDPIPADDGYDTAMGRPPGEPLASDAQLTKLAISMNELGIKAVAERGKYIQAVIGRQIASRKELTVDEASRVIEALAADLDIQDQSRRADAAEHAQDVGDPDADAP